MSSSRTPTKSSGSKKDDPKNARTPTSQNATPSAGSSQRRNVAGSQIASPANRSGAASAASPSANRQKINSADKQNAASPLPSTRIFSRISHCFLSSLFYQSNQRQAGQKLLKMLSVKTSRLFEMKICCFAFVVLPPGIQSLFISSTTQQALQLCVDEDITQENNTKMIEKEVLLNDIQTNGQGSNFFEFQQQIQVG